MKLGKHLAPVVVVALAATLAACSSSGGGTKSTGSAAGSVAPAATSSGSAAVDLGPIKFQLLAEIAGESAVAVNSYYNAYKMAVDDINAKGGILGSKVDGERTPAPLTPQGSVSAFLKAASTKPTAMIGFPANFQAAAAASQIAQTKIPFVSTANVEPTIDRDQKAGSPWLYQLRSSDNIASAGQDADYLVQKLGAKKIGIMYIDVASSPARVAKVKSEVTRLGGTVVAERKHSLTTTDLTGDILAMKSAGADGLVILSYPNQLALAFKQMAQNGYTPPVTATTSLETLIVNKIGTVPSGLKAYAVLDCNVDQSDPAWAKRYTAEFKEPASDVAAGTYDAVMFVAKAIEQAKSTKPDAVRTAMDSLKYTTGVCSKNIYADKQGVLEHGTVMVDYSTSPAKVVTTYP